MSKERQLSNAGVMRRTMNVFHHKKAKNNMRTHARLLVFLLTASSVFTIQAASYKSLTNDERKDFAKTYSSINEAYKAKNYSAIKRFCPDILDRFGSIMLD